MIRPSPSRSSTSASSTTASVPTRDLIVVEVSDVAGSTIIQHANGIWAGISGSPVYSAGKLVGSVSYSFNAGPAYLAGVTPAEDMVKVLDYPASRAAEAAGATRVPLSASIRAKLERRGRTSPRDASLERLPLPLAVSGLSTAHRARLQADMDRLGSPVVVSSGSRATRPTAGSIAGAPVPGGNFASVLAYGDFTAAGIGTTTYVCDGAALAFGHPMLFSGRAMMGAHDASALAIVPGVNQAFKLANVTEPFGTVDQDRLAAIRADHSAPPRRPSRSRRSSRTWTSTSPATVAPTSRPRVISRSPASTTCGRTSMPSMTRSTAAPPRCGTPSRVTCRTATPSS